MAIVEFPSSNIAKEFHAGDLLSTIIVAFIANLYEINTDFKPEEAASKQARDEGRDTAVIVQDISGGRINNCPFDIS
ncbi:hypothetical protein F5144DRAFT_599376 [Chaetomium tenue]|uniref:Uncharacterized protein n=1 Tax=Chaetomium tenue TaxID=1854479 RepID=A0ACB7PI23_9PEZI|nr:hypothetical protein F5144DRAFT_599376 [Chaetomium globosum]